MHDCRKFKDRLVDLLFEPADADERSRLLREANNCESCHNLYRSMSETLTVFDQVAETALPEHAYWTGYEDRLRARLSQQSPPRENAFTALLARISLARFPLPLRIAVASVLVAAGLWLAFNQIETTDPPATEAVNNGEPAAEERQVARDDKRLDRAVPEPIQKTTRSPRRPTNHATHGPKPGRTPDLAARGGGASEPRAASAGLLNLEVVGHVERAELLMRSFRNIKPSEGQTAVDVSYEKELSKELLAKNRLLRRSAENRRNLAVGELLTGIEPLLLDISNLPDGPTQDDVRSIKELIQRQEVVAALQFYSAKASSRNQ